jgi:hypothetical protein
MKSRRVFSTRSISVWSCNTATAPPPGMGAAVTSKTRPEKILAARAMVTSRVVRAVCTDARISGSRTDCTSGAPSRTPLGSKRSMRWLAHKTRSSWATAITASCMEFNSVSKVCRLFSSALKPSSSLRAVLSSADATCAISSPAPSWIRADRSPAATRSAKSVMRSSRLPIDWVATKASRSASSPATAEPSSRSRRISRLASRIELRGYAMRTAPPGMGTAT